MIALALVGFATFVGTTALLASTASVPAAVVGNLPPDQAARLTQSFRASMIAAIVVNGLVLLALVVLIVIGALKRWRWMFRVTLVEFGLLGARPLLGLAAPVLVPVSPPPIGAVPPASPLPLAVSLAVPLETVADLTLFVSMLVAGVRIGPWACRRAIDERPDLPVPATG